MELGSEIQTPPATVNSKSHITHWIGHWVVSQLVWILWCREKSLHPACSTLPYELLQLTQYPVITDFTHKVHFHFAPFSLQHRLLLRDLRFSYGLWGLLFRDKALPVWYIGPNIISLPHYLCLPFHVRITPLSLKMPMALSSKMFVFFYQTIKHCIP
jgi:hypothetical protein